MQVKDITRMLLHLTSLEYYLTKLYCVGRQINPFFWSFSFQLLMDIERHFNSASALLFLFHTTFDTRGFVVLRQRALEIVIDLNHRSRTCMHT